MAAAPRPLVALIRAIGGTTHRTMPLADLCRDVEAAGFGDVRNYLSTGNILLRAREAPNVVARRLEGLIAAYGLANRVFVRRPVEIRRALAANPFPDASRDRPARMLVTFFDDPVPEAAIRALSDRTGSERVGQSKLTPSLIERTAGQPGTARNWNTLHGIIARL